MPLRTFTLKSLMTSGEEIMKSVVILSIISFIKTSDEHRPHATIAGLVIDDITDARQSENDPN